MSPENYPRRRDGRNIIPKERNLIKDPLSGAEREMNGILQHGKICNHTGYQRQVLPAKGPMVGKDTHETPKKRILFAEGWELYY
ncbi:hypothetical protein TNCT_591431 [Trichonephila clavata]|uniref:Uncharacterized protein n=1 Tax=Trichonephila clavata TaxID=2740835 RepID=A0A8X6LPW1_TRICU|nr:hypothetical protein TNCT_591431 [Trichonephila clavata]